MVPHRHPWHTSCVAVCTIMLALFAGCASRQPKWIVKGSGAFPEGEQKAFYGVGSIQGVTNPSLARAAADNRGRAEIAKILETYTAAMMLDYASATAGNDMQRSTQEQHIERTVKTVTKQTVSGVEIIDRWIDDDNGIMYALARLKLSAFKANVERVQELRADVRDYIRENADKAFEALAKEEQQQR